MPTKACIYTRVSRDFSGKHQAVARQEEDCRLMCEMQGWEIVEVYSDNSISAYSGEKRPEFDRMLEDFRRKKFEVIVCWKLDRLCRRSSTLAEMRDETIKNKLCICTSDLGFIDLSQADATFQTALFVTFAEFESARKSERSKRANLQRAMQGKIKPGTRCFGYGQHFELIPNEADCVRRIYKAYLAGASMSAIARAIAGDNPKLDLPHFEAPSIIFARERFNALTDEQRLQLSPVQIARLPHDCFEQIPTSQLEQLSTEDQERIKQEQAKPPKKFDLPVVQNILANPRYAGYTCYVPVVNGKCQSPMTHWADYIVKDNEGKPVKAIWDPIVSEEDWQTVQRKRYKNKFRLDGTRVDRTGSAIRNIGANYYICGICGKTVVSGDKSYRCVHHISRERRLIDAYVLLCAYYRLSMPDTFKLLDYKPDPKTMNNSEKLEKLRKRLQQLFNDYRNEFIDGQQYASLREETQAAIAELETQQFENEPVESHISPLFETNNPAKAFLSITDPGQRQKILREIMSVTLKPHLGGKRYNANTLVSDVIIDWKLLPDPEKLLQLPDIPADFRIPSNPRVVPDWLYTPDGYLTQSHIPQQENAQALKDEAAQAREERLKRFREEHNLSDDARNRFAKEKARLLKHYLEDYDFPDDAPIPFDEKDVQATESLSKPLLEDDGIPDDITVPFDELDAQGASEPHMEPIQINELRSFVHRYKFALNDKYGIRDPLGAVRNTPEFKDIPDFVFDAARITVSIENLAIASLQAHGYNTINDIVRLLNETK